jgi:hypothetical protein
MLKDPNDTEEEHEVVGETFSDNGTTIWYDEEGTQHVEVDDD